jgi:serine protease
VLHVMRRMLVIPMMVAGVLIGPENALSQVQDAPAKASVAPAELPTDRIIIKYKESAHLSASDVGPGSARLQVVNKAAGVSVSYDRAMSGDAHVLKLAGRLPEKEVQAIADEISALPDVEYAEPDRILRPALVPNDPQWSYQWGYSSTYGMNLPAAWNMTTGSSSTVVAVIDTGYRPHTDLSGRFVQGYDFISDSQVANDGDGRDSDAQDPGDWITSAEAASGFFAGCTVENSSWHGTHVAGTIGANTNNSVGVAGINWQAKILPVRVLGKCGGYTSDIVDGMRWAAGLSVSGVPTNTNPAKVLNLSLGGFGSCSTSQQNAINAINATGAVVVVAAGNSNANASNYNPANCNNVIVVGATNKNGTRAYYSNYGSIVDVSAPGGSQSYTNDPNGILSTLNAGTTTPGADSYAYYQGTSMATPHVVGLVSLMAAISPTLNYTGAETILKSTARAFGTGNDCASVGCGAGIIDAYAALVATRITLGDLTPRAYIPFVADITATTGVSITNGDFESGSSGWTEYSTNGYSVIISSGYPVSITPHSGSWLAWLGGAYDEISYVQQQVNVPSSAPYLSYYQWINSAETGCGYDYGKVYINSTQVDSYGLCVSNNTGGWAKHMVDLSSYAGQSVSLMIYSSTDSSVNSNLFIDDVGFQSSAASSATSAPAGAGLPEESISKPQLMGD